MSNAAMDKGGILGICLAHHAQIVSCRGLNSISTSTLNLNPYQKFKDSLIRNINLQPSIKTENLRIYPIDKMKKGNLI